MICITDSSYVYESVEGLDIHFHKIDLRRGSSYIPTPYWIEFKKATVNPKNENDNYCFAYAATIALYHKEIENHTERISNKLIDYANKLDWNGIDFPASAPDYKRFEINTEEIALNVLFVPFNEKEDEEGPENMNIQPEYISKFNFTRKKQIVLLKISNGDRWHFLALKSEQEENSDCMKPTKSFSRLMRDISSNVHGNHYCFGCFHSFRCKSTLEKHTELCKDHDFCKIKLPDKDHNIKKHDFGSKALRMNYIIYVDLECLLVNYDTCSNEPNKSYTINEALHMPSGYPISVLHKSTNSSKVSYYREKDCIQKLCKELRETDEKLFNAKKKKKTMTPLTPDQEKKHNDSYKCYICQSKFNDNKKSVYYKNFKKVKDHDNYTRICRGAAHSLSNFKYVTQRDIPVVIT